MASPPIRHHLTVPDSEEANHNQLSVKSLSDLYLSQNTPSHNPVLSNAILNNLRNRLNEGSTAARPYYTQRRSSSLKSTGSKKILLTNHPLETLFQPPGEFLHEDEEPSMVHVEGGSTSDSRKTSRSSTAPATRSERLQAWLYAFLNQPSNPLAIFYHLILSLLFFVYILLVIFTDRTTWHQHCSPSLLSRRNEVIPSLKSVFERLLVFYFVLFEYGIRLFASRSRPYYVDLPWWRYTLRYHCRLSHIFDLLIVCAGVVASSCQVPLPLDFTQDVHALIVLRGLHRLFNVAQWSSVKARHSPWALMAEVFQEQGSMLFGVFYLETLVVFFMAYFLFLAETHTSEPTDQVTIENMVDALYCSSITLLTIGYGDKTPVTLLGKAIVSGGIIIGLGLFGLPAGIIATSLAIKLNEQDQIRSRSERRQLAAIFIQRTWRFHRRQMRFQIASEIIESKNFDFENGGSSYNYDATLSNIKIDKKLYEKLDYLVSKKIEFLQTQFLDMIKIQLSKRKFHSVLKRHNAIPSNSSRHLIRQHWIEHRQLTELLESMHNRLDGYVNEVPSYEKSFDQMEDKLLKLQTRLKRQRELLEKFNLKL